MILLLSLIAAGALAFALGHAYGEELGAAIVERITR